MRNLTLVSNFKLSNGCQFHKCSHNLGHIWSPRRHVLQVNTIKRHATIKRRENNRTASLSFARYEVISRRSLNWICNFNTRWPKIVRKSMIHHSLPRSGIHSQRIKALWYLSLCLSEEMYVEMWGCVWLIAVLSHDHERVRSSVNKAFSSCFYGIQLNMY